MALLSLAACGGDRTPRLTASEYEATLSGWTGHSESDLIRQWGVPSHSQYLSSGGQALEYDRRVGDRIVCSTLFTSDASGTIRNWTFNGSDCRPPMLGEASAY